MRRLFSSFARGAPGIGLLLLRVAAGSTLIDYGITGLARGAPFVAVAFQAPLILLGSLLLVGLWTPIAAALVTLIAIWEMVSQPAAWSQFASTAVMAAALALLGPGAWSVDAWLYGWKQIRIPARGGEQDSPD